ncbi:hypothetical protein D3C81_366910 [compost metagenome]
MPVDPQPFELKNTTHPISFWIAKSDSNCFTRPRANMTPAYRVADDRPCCYTRTHSSRPLTLMTRSGGFHPAKTGMPSWEQPLQTTSNTIVDHARCLRLATSPITPDRIRWFEVSPVVVTSPLTRQAGLCKLHPFRQVTLPS